MKIKNISPDILYLGFIRQGLRLIPGQEEVVDDKVVKSLSFKTLENTGKLSIVQWDPDPTRYAIKQEVDEEDYSTRDFMATFLFNSAYPYTVKNLTLPSKIDEITIQIVVPFTPGVKFGVGFPSNPDGIIDRNDLDFSVIRTYTIPYYKPIVFAEPLYIYKYGVPLVGSGNLFFEG